MFQDNFITFVPARKTALEVSEWEDDCKKNPLYKTIEKVNRSPAGRFARSNAERAGGARPLPT